MGKQGHRIVFRCPGNLQHWEKQKYVQHHSIPTSQMRGALAKENSARSTQCCLSNHQTTKPRIAPMVTGKISATETGATSGSAFHGLGQYSKRGKYVDLGKSLLIQFLINSDSSFMYWKKKRGKSNIENPKDLSWWQNIT